MERINHRKYKLFKSTHILRTIVLAILASAFACERWIDPEYNIDPGAPDDVPMSMLIPTIQLSIGFNLMGINTVQVTNIWMQYYTGVNYPDMWKYTDYNLDARDWAFDAPWGQIYSQQLINAKILIEKAEQSQSPYNAAVGQILTAYALGIATDLYGNVPYTNALKGGENVLKVPFDTQEQIYASIDSLLDRAITNLNVDPAENLIAIEGDGYYEGNHEAWLKAARAVKARHKLQLSKRRGIPAYSDALALTNAFTRNADNMKCPFRAPTQNPHYQDAQYDAVVMCQTFLDELEGQNDPRIPFYFGKDTAGGISAAPPGERYSQASKPGVYLAAEEAPLYLMTFSELKFIEAEAALMTGDADRAVTAYKTAVSASLLEVTGDSNQTWMDTIINPENSGSITLEKILMQKRRALFGQVQPYSDWRRTGIPELTVVPEAQLPEIPQRYLYPYIETFTNEGNVPYVTLTDPVWWAADPAD
jgi:hypothetical protein